MTLMGFFFRRKGRSSSAFSEFVRNASSRDRKRVYTKVLEKATEQQKAVIERASQTPK
jgi:hypothetical protein